MQAIERHIAEMKRLRIAFSNTKSGYLKNDYAKAIRRMQGELREYCDHRCLNYKEVINDLFGDKL